MFDTDENGRQPAIASISTGFGLPSWVRRNHAGWNARTDGSGAIA